MLEIIGIIALCRLNARNASMRGRSAGWAKGYTVLLWVFFEIIGGITGASLIYSSSSDFNPSYYFMALLGAGLGALLSWLIARRGQPTMQAYGNMTVNETAYVQNAYPLSNPCQVVLTRQKSLVGMAVSFTIQLNGQVVGSVGNGQSITFPAYSAHNVLTGTDALGMRFNSSVPFEAPDGGRVDVVMKGAKFLPALTRVYAGAPQQQSYDTRCPHCQVWGFAPAPNCPACGAPLQQ